MVGVFEFKRYQELASRTAGAGADDPRLQLAVSTLGLCGEVASELKEAYFTLLATGDNEPFADELGDVLWYVADIATCSRLTLNFQPPMMPMDGADVFGRLEILAGKVADHVKKHVGHGHELDRDKLRNWLEMIISAVVSLVAYLNGPSIFDVAYQNIKKLSSRYPEGFSEEASQERVI